jgi:hypothetical protein
MQGKQWREREREIYACRENVGEKLSDGCRENSRERLSDDCRENGGGRERERVSE